VCVSTGGQWPGKRRRLCCSRCTDSARALSALQGLLLLLRGACVAHQQRARACVHSNEFTHAHAHAHSHMHMHMRMHMQVRVVILGQDPYINEREAMGLSFSVPPGAFD
jgi:hypothetical protein